MESDSKKRRVRDADSTALVVSLRFRRVVALVTKIWKPLALGTNLFCELIKKNFLK